MARWPIPQSTRCSTRAEPNIASIYLGILKPLYWRARALSRAMPGAIYSKMRATSSMPKPSFSVRR